MRLDTGIFGQHNRARTKLPRYVSEVAFDSANTILWYFPSHADAALPGGASSVGPVISSFSGTSQTLNPDQANATIGSMDFSFVDRSSIVTETLGTELALGRSTRQQRVRAFMGYQGDAFADYKLIQTQLVNEIGHTAGMYALRCQDIQRAMRNDIFVKATTPLAANVAASQLSVSCALGAAVLTVGDTTDFPASGSGVIRENGPTDIDFFSWTGKTPTTLTGCTGVLAHSIGATVCDATINVTSTAAFAMVAHGTSYGDAPSQTVGYGKIDSEVFSYTGKTATTFTGCVRGALNTVAAAHQVDLTSAPDQRTQVTEYVYLELPSVDLMYQLLTGLDRLGNPALPTSWNLGIDPVYVRLTDFTGIGKDLWDLTDDDAGFVVRFEDLDKTDGKKFIETELALLTGVFMPIYADGAVGCRRMANVGPGAAYSELLDESNVVSCGELKYDMTSLYNVIQISWNWEPLQKDFTRVNIFPDQNSITIHKKAPTLKLSFRGLHGSRHSAAMLAGRFDMIRDRYTSPPYRFTLKTLHRFNSIEVGDVLRVKLRGVRDFVANGTLDRSFEVQGITIDWVTGALNLQLFASTGAAGPVAATGDSVVIPDAWYGSRGVLLSTVLTVVAGHVTVSGTLTGNADGSLAIYYFLGDLTINSGVNIAVTQNARLYVMGNFDNRGTINGKGAGLPGAAAPATPPITNDLTDPSYEIPGTPGFLGTTQAGGGMLFRFPTSADAAHHHTGDIFSIPAKLIQGATSVVPAFNISWNNTDLIGLPTDLRGSAGGSGRVSGDLGVAGAGHDQTTPRTSAGAGGAGGAGLVIVSRGYSTGASGRIDLSGADGTRGTISPSIVDIPDGMVVGGSGAGGAPGGLLIVLDGAGVTATGLTDSGFVALQGNTFINGTPEPSQDVGGIDNNTLVIGGYSFFVGTGDGTTFPRPNLSGGRGGSRVQYVLNDAAGATPDPTEATLPAPTSLGLASGPTEVLQPGFGVTLARIKVTWVPATDARVVGYDLQFKPSTSADWESAPSVLGQGTNVARLTGVIAGTNYDVRIRSVGAIREVSDWVTITGFTVYGLTTGAPANVTNFSAQQQGVVVSFNWDQLSDDYALKGYDIGFAPQGTTDWNLFEPLTEAAKGTEMTNASVPPGTWVFGIRARNVANQLSPAAALFNLTVTNANPLISQVPQEKDWLGTLVNFVRHWTGVLVPLGTKNVSAYTRVNPPSAPTLGTTPGGSLSLVTYFVKVTYTTDAGGESTPSAEASQLVLLNNLLTVASPGASSPATGYNIYVSAASGTETLQNAAPIPLGTSWTEPASGLVSGVALPTVNTTGFEPFNSFVPDVVSTASYTAPQVDTGLDDTVRVFATEAAAMGPGQSGVPSMQLAIDTWLTAGSDLGIFTNWVLGTLPMRFLRSRLTLTVVQGAVPYVTDFTPTVDKAPVIEHADSVVVAPGGTAVTFPSPFHLPPNVQVTPISAGVTSASAVSITTTGFTAHVFNGGTDSGGTINWVATGE